MKSYKKILLGLGLAVAAVLVGIGFSQKALAEPANTQTFSGALYRVTQLANDCSNEDRNTNPVRVRVNIDSRDYVFEDTDPCDDLNNLKYYGSGTFICNQSNAPTNHGITITGGPTPRDGGGNTYSGTIRLVYWTNTDEECRNGQPNQLLPVTPITLYHNVPNPPPPGDANPSQPDDVEPTCEATWSNPLTWIMCPLFNIAADLTNELVGFLEGQLCFKVDASPTSANTECQVTDTSSIKPAWNIIKNLVSAVLVIIMLLAVFAQAASIGPVDAYTLRKLLPRLVAAVILIQISFYLFSWVINLVDDMGEGLSSLFGAVFPADINNLNVLLGNAGVGDGTATAVNWLAVLGFIGFAIAALPALLLAIFSAVIALLIGLAVLVFRKVVIIALLIISPVALLLWILPNTERYWKMWWDNFLKVLLMYPIIVLLIEAGRIFAYVTGPATGGGFIGLFIVLIGFFGPLFLLPKTYRWGGTLMMAAGNTMTSLSRPLPEKGGAAIRGWGERKQGEWAKQYNPAAGRVTRGLRRIQSGHLLPTERSRRLTIAAGDKWAAERNDEASALVARTYEKALADGYEYKYRDPESGEIKTEQLRGVAAGKQALIDIAGTEKTDDASARAGMAAVKQLLDTSSWIELQSSRVSVGKGVNEGKRVPELGDMWNKTLETSPQHYGSVAGRRPDFAPHMLESYQRRLEAGNYGDPRTPEAVARRDAARVAQAVTQLKGADLQNVDQRFYEEIARVGDQRVEVKNPDGTTVAKTLSQVLGDHLQTIANTPGAGQYNVSQLSGGELGAKVNAALAAGNYGRDLTQIVHGTAAPARTEVPPTATPAAPAAPSPGPTVVTTPGPTVVREVPTEGGVIHIQQKPKVINIQPGETSTPGGVIIPPGTKSMEHPSPEDEPPRNPPVA